ncbi:MAG TPA: helix-turn-helix domain-containing protein, partial [Patescibacteria group bacterium]|nr:helix-turn-helix domain-containing protein [Patescibacteria group bacterium]
RSGVSRVEFAELFPDREACLLAAFDLGVERAARRVVPAYEAEVRWIDAIKMALATFLRFLEEEPALGRLCVVHALGGGPEVLRRRMEVLEVLSAAVDRGRLEVPAGRQQPPAVIAEGVVGAVLSVIQNRLLAEEPKPPMELFGSLASMVALPYLGSAVARRELTRPAPRIRWGEEPAADGTEEVLEEDVGTRLTYRTARVLAAINAYPGASNREVAERAGIVDQGQVSKLLARLEARGLIANIDGGRPRGAPNAWRLTERGERVLRSAGVRSLGADPQRGV